jgi:hypothetical protein
VRGRLVVGAGLESPQAMSGLAADPCRLPNADTGRERGLCVAAGIPCCLASHSFARHLGQQSNQHELFNPGCDRENAMICST